ncbi:centrosomal protein of 83 kDa-like isoform X2 [Lutzomyia longipalpis]|uniref:centrosomal protein of 83 kDa-like isoform X2 n=1 Tax=Lutzomyia longipalpis TaxID=7200 RepID=UPI0024846D08|nr:centrosomal protein of 83 kDa-like isoform X2 [Lutzomyia longipalpis]
MSESEKAVEPEIGENICESRALSVIQEFTSIYEDRIKFIEKEIGSDCHEIKLPIYKRWVEDLTVQNTELVRAVEELETVVSDRLSLLEERLQQEKYNLHDRRVFRLESDIQNLLQFLQRAMRNNTWSTDGLTFHEINLEQTLSDYRDEKESTASRITLEMTPESSRFFTEGLEDISKEVSSIRDDIRSSTLMQSHDEKIAKSFEENTILRDKVESANREIALLKAKIKEMEKGTIDTQVLAQEIAAKHDTIQKMRSDNTYLEEQIRQASMQIHFKDDVIKELRRDIANLKKYPNLIDTPNDSTQDSASNNDTPNGNSLESSVSDLSRDVHTTKADLNEMGKHRREAEEMLKNIQEELNELKLELNLEIPVETSENDDQTIVPEKEMLSAIKHELFNLRKTNSFLSEENAKIHGEAEQLREQLKNFTSQTEHVSRQGRQLEEMQQVLTKLRNSIKTFGGNQEDIAEEGMSDSDLLANLSDVLEDLRRENAAKSCIVAEKDKKIETLMGLIEEQKVEIEKFSKNEDLWEAERGKNENMIEDLRKAIAMHMDTVNELKNANEDLTKRLKDMESQQSNEIFAKLLADRNRLEVECHHQMTTISNLKAAVENIKKETKSVSSPAASSGSSSLWGWWRTVHDV